MKIVPSLIDIPPTARFLIFHITHPHPKSNYHLLITPPSILQSPTPSLLPSTLCNPQHLVTQSSPATLPLRHLPLHTTSAVAFSFPFPAAKSVATAACFTCTTSGTELLLYPALLNDDDEANDDEDISEPELLANAEDDVRGLELDRELLLATELPADDEAGSDEDSDEDIPELDVKMRVLLDT